MGQVRLSHLVQQEWRGVGVRVAPGPLNVGVPYSGVGLSRREGCGPGSHNPQLCLSKDHAISPPTRSPVCPLLIPLQTKAI